MGKPAWIWSQEAWLLVLNLSLPSCVTLAVQHHSLSFNSFVESLSIGPEAPAEPFPSGLSGS